MRTPRRLAVALSAVALAVTGASQAAATAATTVPTAEPTTGPTAEPTTVPTAEPPLDPAALRAAIAGLPNNEASGAILRLRGSDGRWQGTSGVADIHTGRPVPQRGRFRIGSMTKSFTATAALRLVACGRLRLDRTAQSYVPGVLPAEYPPITIRQLLNYTSGLPGIHIDHKDPTWFLAHRFDTWTPRQLLDLAFTGRPMEFAPGTKQHYGNISYLVLGVVIEKVTGRPYGDAITDAVIRPLHLTATSVPGSDPKIRGPHAHGYELTPDGTYVDITEANPTFQWSAAEMISNAPDLDRFLVALMSGRLLPPAQTALLFDVPDVPTYDGDTDPTNDEPAQFGLGLGRYIVGDMVFWGKTGDRPGYQNGMAATRDLSRRAVYSVNTLHMGGELSPVTQGIIAAVAGVA